jgi:hypothetical protein
MIVSAIFEEKTILSSLNCLCTIVKKIVHVYVGIMAGISLSSIGLYVHPFFLCVIFEIGPGWL